MLSIIIPCHNEQGVIASTVEELLKENEKRQIDTEFVLVNNNSSDNTLDVLNEIAAAHNNIKVVSTPPTPGYGVACRWGVYCATGEFVLITMADASESPNEVFGRGVSKQCMVRDLRTKFVVAFRGASSGG